MADLSFLPDKPKKEDLYKKGLESFLGGDRGKAKTFWEESLKIDPAFKEAKMGLERLASSKKSINKKAMDFYKEGLNAFLEEDIVKAEDLWKKSLEADPSLPESQRGLERLASIKRGQEATQVGENIIGGIPAGEVQAKEDLSFLPDQPKEDLSFLPDKPEDLSFLPDKPTRTPIQKIAEKVSDVVKGITEKVSDYAKFYPENIQELRKQLGVMPGQAGVSGDLQQVGEKVGMAANPIIDRIEEKILTAGNKFPHLTAAALTPASLYVDMELTPRDFAMATPIVAGMHIATSFLGRSTGKSTAVNMGPGKWALFKRGVYDKFEPIKYLEGKEIYPELAEAGGKYTKSYVDARLLSSRIKGKAAEYLDEVEAIIKPLKNYEDRLLLNKVYSLKNFADLDLAGRRTAGVTARDATNQLAELKKTIGDQKFQEIADVAGKLADLQNDKALNMLVESKVITEKAAEALRDRFPNYLRSEILDEQLMNNIPGFRGPSGKPLGRVNKDFLKTKKGTELQISDDVIDLTRRSLLEKVAAAEKQKVVDTIAKEFGQEIGKKTYTEKGMIEKFDPDKIPPGYVKSSLKSSDGKVYAVEKEVENLLHGMNELEADIVTKSISKFNNLFRATATTYRLPFILTNISRDIQTAIFNKRFVPGQTSQLGAFAKGIITAIKEGFGIKDKVFSDWRASGGPYGGLVTSVSKQKPIPFRLRTPAQKAITAATKPFTVPFEIVGKLAEISENSTRLAEYIRLKNTNMPKELKTLQSRDITVDFEKMGDGMKLWNKLVPFLNANVQGTINTMRAFRDQPGRSIMRAGAYIAVPAIGLYAWNKQFDNDKYVDPYIKENFWYINTGISTKRNGRDAPVLGLIRKGEFAKQLSAPIESLLEASVDDPMIKERIKDWSINNVGSGIIASFTPPPVRVALEEGANYDFFRKRQIVPMGQEDVKAGRQFRAGTTDTARKLGELTGISPIRFEHTLSGLLPISKMGLEVSDTVLRPHPEVPRKESDILQKTQAFQPIVRGASGYYSPVESEAQRFMKEERERKRTPKFLFKQAYRLYLDKRTDENYQRVAKLFKEVDPADRADAIRSVNKEYRQQQMPDEQRALQKIPRKEKRKFLSR